MLPQLDFTHFLSQIFWLFVSFAVLYVLMARAALPKVRDVLQNRENRITGDIEKAEEMKREAESARADYLTSLESARSKSSDLIAAANASIKREAAERHATLDKKLAEQSKEAELRLSTLRDDTKKQLESVTIELAQEIVKKVLSVNINDESAKAALRRVG